MSENKISEQSMGKEQVVVIRNDKVFEISTEVFQILSTLVTNAMLSNIGAAYIDKNDNLHINTISGNENKLDVGSEK